MPAHPNINPYNNHYTDYQNFKSLGLTAPLSSQGRIQPEENATGFGYTKRILFHASSPGGDRDYAVFKGNWHVKLLESDVENATVLFEQEVFMNVLGVFDGFGGVTFYPLLADDKRGDGDSSGLCVTSIVNGQPVPQDEDGHYEGWRFLDTPHPAPKDEFAIADFNGNAGGSAGGLLIDILWNGPNYKLDVPSTAIFEVVTDNWRLGTVVPIAFFSGSLFIGDAPPPALFDTRTGQQFRATTKDGETRVLRSRRQLSPLEPDRSEWSSATPDGLVIDKTQRGLNLSRVGSALLLLGQEGSNLQLSRSHDEGQTWHSLMTQPSEITLLAARLSRNGARYTIYGVDKDKIPSFVILKNEADGWTVSQSGACQGEDLPTSKVNALEEAEGGTLRLLATTGDGNLQLFNSPDGITYQQSPPPPTKDEPE